MNSNLALMTKIFLTTIGMLVFSLALIAQETVTDIDGNVYNTVTIGTQVWMKENLKTTHYSNSDGIPNVTNAAAWGGLTSGAYCCYDNDTANAAIYGLLYNWYAVVDNRNIAPEGWHVPADSDWTTLIDYLGGSSVAGGKMKDTVATYWSSPNEGADNSSGFTGLPGGDRVTNGSFFLLHDYGFFWSVTEINATYGIACALAYQVALIDKGNYQKLCGYSVRCLKDIETEVDDSKNSVIIPSELKLDQNYPNPFNTSTIIQYSLGKPSIVKLAIYNTLGQQVKILENSYKAAGEYSLVWDGTDLNGRTVNSGVYFYQLSTNYFKQQKKMLLVQ